MEVEVGLAFLEVESESGWAQLRNESLSVAAAPSAADEPIIDDRTGLAK